MQKNKQTNKKCTIDRYYYYYYYFVFHRKGSAGASSKKKISCETQGVDGIKNLIFISRKQNSGENLIKNNLHENFQVEKIFCSLAFPKGAARRM